ncbi:alpha/beta fold hydrolase [Thalassotalea agarivorans]|uniref:Esterase n=1 Tax=Thalassotalea agarivorans TaxID=349064 RepID=A0A1I0GUT6_THASX|nr:alpha/beta fold hydrolase [Thalassotalea agarivorans]SET75128.1 esterase [Thalassotalea agarivorans]
MTILNYNQIGEGSDLLLIHGLFGSLENLNMVAKPLSQHFRVTSVDVRNHGISPHVSGMSYEEMSQDVLDTLDHLNIDSTDVLGHSMGGKIAMHLALHHGERIKKLVVADIAPVQYPPHHERIIAGLKMLEASTIESRKQADQRLAEYVEEAGVRQFLLRNLKTDNDQMSFKCDVTKIADGYGQIMKGIDSANAFEGKTLFVIGGDSDYVTPAHQSHINALFSDVRAKIIQGTGHWLHAEKPTAFNKVVSHFLTQA